MAANGQGVVASREVDLSFYDRLPAELREMLRDAPMALSAEEIDGFRRKLDAKELAEEIRARVAAVQNVLTNQAYGEDHPQIGATSYGLKALRHRKHVRRR